MRKKLLMIALKAGEARLYDFINLQKNVLALPAGYAAVAGGNNLYIGPLFWDEPESAQIGILLHEAMHVGLRHVGLKHVGLNRKKMNVSEDIIINEMIESIGYTIPKCGIFRRTYGVPVEHDTTLKVYYWLPDEAQDDDPHDAQGDPHDAQGDPHDAQTQHAAGRLWHTIKSRVDEVQIKSYPEPELAAHLAVDVGRLIKRTYNRSFKRPYRLSHLLPRGVVAPNRRKATHIPRINVYIDTSGSMEGDRIAYVLGAIQQLKRQLREHKPTYYGFNVDVYPLPDLHNVSTGGGTAFTADSMMPNADHHIILTDGELNVGEITARNDTSLYVLKNDKFTRIDCGVRA